MTLQIQLLPDPPSRADPVNFSPRADAFLGALPAFVVEANALAVEANDNSVIAVTKAQEASDSAADALASEVVSRNFAEFTGGIVPGFPGEYSAREWSNGTVVPSGSAKEWATGSSVSEGSSKRWATLLNIPVDGVQYSAKEWAIGGIVPEGSAKFWSQVAQTTAQFQGAYDSLFSYDRGQTVVDPGSGLIYVSIVDNNLGFPLTDNQKWIRIAGTSGAQNSKLLFFGSF